MAEPITDKARQRQSLLAFQEVQQRVRDEEKEFAKGFGKGMLSNVAFAGDLANMALPGQPFPGTEQAKEWLLGDDASAAERSGAELGQWVDPTGVADNLALKAGVFVGIRAGSTKLADATDAYRRLERIKLGRSTETAKGVWESTKGWFDLNFGVKDAPVNIARHIPTNDLAINMVDPSTLRRLAAGDAVPIVDALDGLSEVFMDYKDLFRNYHVQFADLGPAIFGQHQRDAKLITLNSAFFKPDQLSDRGKNTLIHEIQHAIQAHEGWIGTGSNTNFGGNAWEKRLSVEEFVKSKRLAIAERYQTYFNDQIKALEPLYDKVVNSKDFGSDLGKMIEYEANKKKLDTAVNAMFGMADEDIGDLMTQLSRFGLELPDWVRHGAWMVKKGTPMELATTKSKTAFDLPQFFYTTDIGEAWARAAGKSWNLSKEGTETIPPWRFLDVAPKAMSGSDPANATGYFKWLKEQKELAATGGVLRTP